MAKSSGTLKVARWSAEHPWRAVLIWVAFVAAAVAAGSTFSTQETTDADYRHGDSGRAEQITQQAGLDEPSTEHVLITARDGELNRATAESVASDLQREMRTEPVVAHVGDPVWSADKHALMLSVQLPRGDDDPDVTGLQDITASAQADHPGLRIEETGDASLNAAINDVVADDLASAEGISLPVTFIIMLLAFGALIAAGIPVLLAISAVVATIALYAPLSHIVPSEDTVSSMILLIGMAVGVDYSLFYLKRAREERRRGRSTIDAVEVAAATSGHSIVVSGCAVIVAMGGLYVAQDATFNSLATGAILVVAIAVLGSLTVLPALLAKLGRWVDRPRVPLLWRLNRRIGQGGISRRLLGPILAHPVASLLMSAVVVGGLAVPALGMDMKQPGLSALPQSIPQVQTMQRMQESFPTEGSDLDVVVKAAPGDRDAVVRALHQLQDKAAQNPGFTASGPAAIRTSADGTVSVLTLTSPHGEGTEAAMQPLNLLRNVWGPQLLDHVGPTADWMVGGGIATSYDSSQHQSDKLPWVIGFVLLLTLLMMGFTFKSVPIAIITTLLNLASVTAAFGVLTLVFQHSWADGLLGYHSSGIVVDWIPLFLFVVLAGLSMDYHVFVLSRVREAIRRGLPPRLAVESGVSDTAGVVTSAAAVMVSVFAIFAPLSLLAMKQMGVGLAVAVLIDATLVRVVMLPSILVLLDKFAWWPMRIRKPQIEPVEAEPEYAH
ncbi:MAG: MMPL family transporter [Nocardioidaceae bacterium]